LESGADWLINSYIVGMADGPTEVHKITVAKEALKAFVPTTAMFPAAMRAPEAA